MVATVPWRKKEENSSHYLVVSCQHSFTKAFFHLYLKPSLGYPDQ